MMAESRIRVLKDDSITDEEMCIHVKKEYKDIELQFHCVMCRAVFNLEEQLRKHIQQRHSYIEGKVKQEFQCPIGNFLHLKNELNKEHPNYQTSACVKTEPELSMKTEETSDQCQKGESLKIHTREKSYFCNTCQKRFSRSAHLKRHMRVHSGEKPYACKKSFSHSETLKTHMNTHTGEKLYSCDTCKKSFSQNAHLKTHMRFHTGEKPYSCDVCMKTFSQSVCLKLHIITHTGEKPYSCDICQKQFSERGKLRRHLITHTGDKPYSCDVCSKSVSESGNLKQHILTHIGEKPYSCDFCEKTYSYSRSLKSHIITHTGEKRIE